MRISLASCVATLFFLTLSLQAQLIFPMLQDADKTVNELESGQPAVVYSPSAQEVLWLNAEARRRWNVDWADLAAEGEKGRARQALLYRWLGSVLAENRNVPAAPVLSDAPARADRRIITRVSPTALPDSD